MKLLNQYIVLAFIVVSFQQINAQVPDYSPLDFGPVCNQLTIEMAINSAVINCGGVTFPDAMICTMSKVNVRHGIKYMRGGTIKLIKDATDGPFGFNLLGIAHNNPSNVKDLTIEDIVFDQNYVNSRTIYGINTSRLLVQNCTFNNGGERNRGIALFAESTGQEDMQDNVIINNSFYGIQSHGEAIFIHSRILDTLPPSGRGSYWQQFKAIPPANFRAYNTIIANNYIDGSYYGIGVTKAINTFIENNTITNCTRNISLQKETNCSIVRNNNLSNSISSSIHLGQGSSHNLIENNIITTNESIGEGLLQAYVAASHNVFRDNILNVSLTAEGLAPRWMIYNAIHSNNNIFDRNTLNGPARFAYIGVETAWYSNITDKAHRGNYAGWKTNLYADEGLSGLQITNNIINPANDTSRILITEVTDSSLGSYYLTNSIINNNIILNETNYCIETILDSLNTTSHDFNLDHNVDACTINEGTVWTQNDGVDIVSENGATLVDASPFIQVPENIQTPQPISKIIYADNDNDAITFSISSASPDFNHFSVDHTGLLQFTPATVPDYELPGSRDADNIYTVIVEVNDNSSSPKNYRDLQIFHIEVTDVIDETLTSDDCIPIRMINYSMPNGLYSAHDAIISNGKVFGENVVFEAGNHILLDKGFEAHPNSIISNSLFLADIWDCRELLVNGDFEDNTVAPWNLGLYQGGTASASLDPIFPYEGLNAARINVTNGPGTHWNIQFEQSGFSTIAGQTYIVEFAARSNTTTIDTIPIHVFRHVSPNTSSLWKNIFLDNEWQTFSFPFTPDVTNDGQVRVAALLGKYAIRSYWFDNFSIKPQQ